MILQFGVVDGVADCLTKSDKNAIVKAGVQNGVFGGGA
jgi:hypothetical protein